MDRVSTRGLAITIRDLRLYARQQFSDLYSRKRDITVLRQWISQYPFVLLEEGEVPASQEVEIIELEEILGQKRKRTGEHFLR